MTDNEIIKALECCVGGYGVRNCDDCSIQGKAGCIETLPQFALDIITHQKAEIERLEKELELANAERVIAETHEKDAKEMFVDVTQQLKTAKSEAIKEFAERLKKSLDWRTEPIDDYDIDDLVKEMTEDKENV